MIDSLISSWKDDERNSFIREWIRDLLCVCVCVYTLFSIQVVLCITQTSRKGAFFRWEAICQDLPSFWLVIRVLKNNV